MAEDYPIMPICFWIYEDGLHIAVKLECRFFFLGVRILRASSALVQGCRWRRLAWVLVGDRINHHFRVAISRKIIFTTVVIDMIEKHVTTCCAFSATILKVVIMVGYRKMMAVAASNRKAHIKAGWILAQSL